MTSFTMTKDGKTYGPFDSWKAAVEFVDPKTSGKNSHTARKWLIKKGYDEDSLPEVTSNPRKPLIDRIEEDALEIDKDAIEKLQEEIMADIATMTTAEEIEGVQAKRAKLEELKNPKATLETVLAHVTKLYNDKHKDTK